MIREYDYIIIGAGIMGLTLADVIKKNKPAASVLVIEKESEEACHASGRNSGVLHAGFYYTANSLKARLTVEGNRTMKVFCRENDILVNACGKLVVAQNESELSSLYELEKRGKTNGSNIKMIDEKEAAAIEPNVKTYRKALYSPDTASVDAKVICHVLKTKLENAGIIFQFNDIFISQKNNVCVTERGEYQARHVINCAGLYADKIAHAFGFGKEYTMIPFKGLYLKYTKDNTAIKINIYPVPNLKNPFLGVHFTKMADGTIKIGPTAMPAFWRENYKGWENFRFAELAEILFQEAKLYLSNAFHFRDLAHEEWKKAGKDYLIKLAMKMVREIDPKGFTEFSRPGIRAQLLHKKNNQLVQDFIIEGDKHSTHILNAVSPAFTCAFPFSSYVYSKYLG